MFKTVVVTKPLNFLITSPILFSKFCLSVLYLFERIKEVATGFFPEFVFDFSMLKFVFSTTFLLTISLNFFKSIGTVFSFAYVFKLSKLVKTTNLLMLRLTASVFKSIIPFLAAKIDVSLPVAIVNYF